MNDDTVFYIKVWCGILIGAVVVYGLYGLVHSLNSMFAGAAALMP